MLQYQLITSCSRSTIYMRVILEGINQKDLMTLRKSD
jgi:hypothetical protein